ncbi:MAG: DNA integrity scanning diadenylate cyclase DisA [Candidatus Pacearchaeota archaeon]
METKLKILEMFSYGSILRNAIEKITRAYRGALIVFADNNNFKKITKICKGGFKVNKKLTEELLVELAKLDGAIIVKDDKIVYANVLLTPNSRIVSEETGTRHQAAERTAKQFNAIVLAISEKTKIATVYYGNKKLRLNYISDLLIKARETFSVLDRHRENFEKLVKHLNTAEILDIVNIEDIANIFQRKKIFDYISDILLLYLAELGVEGRTIKFQFEEIKNFINEEIESIKRDYHNQINFDNIEEALNKADYHEIISPKFIIKLFESNKLVDHLTPLGYRLLKKIYIINENERELIIKNFGNLKNIIEADINDFIEKGIKEKKAKKIKEFFSSL